jgi:hypothetical protein
MLLSLIIKKNKAIWLKCVAMKYEEQDEGLMMWYRNGVA